MVAYWCQGCNIISWYPTCHSCNMLLEITTSLFIKIASKHRTGVSKVFFDLLKIVCTMLKKLCWCCHENNKTKAWWSQDVVLHRAIEGGVSLAFESIDIVQCYLLYSVVGQCVQQETMHASIIHGWLFIYYHRHGFFLGHEENYMLSGWYVRGIPQCRMYQEDEIVHQVIMMLGDRWSDVLFVHQYLFLLVLDRSGWEWCLLLPSWSLLCLLLFADHCCRRHQDQNLWYTMRDFLPGHVNEGWVIMGYVTG